MNPSLPFTSSPDPTPSQNPLSLMMSQMSKYAMPSSTPLYHNAIKTIATSDDELLPDRPLLPPPPPPQGSGPGARTHREKVATGRRVDMGTEGGESGHGQQPPLWSCWLLCASRGPWEWECDVLGHSSHLHSHLVKPSPGYLNNLSSISTAYMANWARNWVSWLLT